MDHVKVFTEFVTILFLFHVLFFLSRRLGILAPQPGIKLTPSASEGEVLTAGPPWKSLEEQSFKADIMYYEPSPPTHRDILPLYLPQAPRVKAEAKTIVLHREQRCQAALKFSNSGTRRQRSELFFERQKQMARVLKLHGFLQDREDMLNGLNEGVDRTWETNMGKEGTCYRLNCIPLPTSKKKKK